MAYNLTQQSRINNGLCPQCGQVNLSGKVYCELCRQEKRERQDELVQKQVLGKQCVCCKESEPLFLTTYGKNGKVYIVCFNCQGAGKRKGSCPHEAKPKPQTMQVPEALGKGPIGEDQIEERKPSVAVATDEPMSEAKLKRIAVLDKLLRQTS